MQYIWTCVRNVCVCYSQPILSSADTRMFCNIVLRLYVWTANAAVIRVVAMFITSWASIFLFSFFLFLLLLFSSVWTLCMKRMNKTMQKYCSANLPFRKQQTDRNWAVILPQKLIKWGIQLTSICYLDLANDKRENFSVCDCEIWGRLGKSCPGKSWSVSQMCRLKWMHARFSAGFESTLYLPVMYNVSSLLSNFS